MNNSDTAAVHPLSRLQTEGRNAQSSNIDVIPTMELCRIMNNEDAKVAEAVEYCLESIAAVIDLTADRVRKTGRVIYIGAGTSGRCHPCPLIFCTSRRELTQFCRLGILDASEIPPTFSAPPSQFIGIMAGGDRAIRKAIEGAEDSATLAAQDLESLDPPMSQLDTVIGIAASGRTPYVIGGLSYAQSLGALTIGICCVRPSDMRGSCDYAIECLVGPEIVTGSTRLKAGTATKLILNMISTGVMIRIGKTYGNLMVDVKPSNLKLRDRARRIFRTVLPATALSDLQIDELLSSCQDNVKLALVVENHKCSVLDAAKILHDAEGVLKRALEGSLDIEDTLPAHVASTNDRLVLCIDAGGTKCKAVIATRDGIICHGEAGPCNFVTLGHDVALSVLRKAVTDALSKLPSNYTIVPILPPEGPIFVGAWIGGAGLDRTADLASIRLRIVALLNLADPTKLMVTNDAALLSSAIVAPQNPNPSQSQVLGGIVLVTGTGTLAYSYSLPKDGQSSLPAPINRTSGWGYLLGDEGSAFAIGRDAIRAALDQRDRGLPPTRLHLAITRCFGCQSVGELISAVYLNAPPILKDGQDPSSVDPDPKLRVAGVCRVVFSHAFPSSPDIMVDVEALKIAQKAASSAADTVTYLLSDDSDICSSSSVLVFGGALAQVGPYRQMIVGALRAKGHQFVRLECVQNAAEVGVQVLIRDLLV
ncbi:N-acetylmuramic acid 6-phosphate [Macrolepiota fuliginosa MF-IS2]|uniref:N-acetylmuramic acid 6-phosphate n=1 Tax=Macrolepiota fuliginosa MF-IS2 TaxID=1400762 RepID=A0A9P6C6F1_9AGAR|nr:N-acetylmuramic acid 6-phosphate [Macrolepiota fuliginosa MF-IS2]